jgi:hypothetical protein
MLLHFDFLQMDVTTRWMRVKDDRESTVSRKSLLRLLILDENGMGGTECF